MNQLPTRLTIILDVDDPNPDLLFIWAGLRALKFVEELSNNGIAADVVSLDVDGDCHYSW
jgi:hypothetical protein